MSSKEMGKGIELITIRDVGYETTEGEVVISKTNVKTKLYIADINDITAVEQVFNDNGNIRLSVTQVTHRDLGTRLIYENYHKLLKRLEIKPMGYGTI